jgi:hypothetical protein
VTQQWLVPLSSIKYFANKIRVEAADDDVARAEIELLGYSVGLGSGAAQGRCTVDQLLDEHQSHRYSNEWQNRGFSKIQMARDAAGRLTAVLEQYMPEHYDEHPLYKGLLDGYLTAVLGARVSARIGEERGPRLVFAIEAAASQPPASAEPEKLKYELPAGRFKLIEEDSQRKAYQEFANYVRSGVPGLCVTHQHPTTVLKESGAEGFEIAYLSDEDAGKKSDNAVSPKRMKFELAQRIGRFLTEREMEGKPGIILFTGLTNLRMYNSFEDLYEFMDRTAKRLARAQSFGVVYLKPGSLEGTETRKMADLFGG